MVSGGLPGNSFKWQEDSGSGFHDVNDRDPASDGSSAGYSGTDGKRLDLTGIPSSYNGYKYKLKMVGPNGTVYSNEATLTVIGGLKIIKHPEDTDAKAFEQAEFEVEAEGAAHYRWEIGYSGSAASLIAKAGKKLVGGYDALFDFADGFFESLTGGYVCAASEYER